jgi:hypothetical protein
MVPQRVVCSHHAPRHCAAPGIYLWSLDAFFLRRFSMYLSRRPDFCDGQTAPRAAPATVSIVLMARPAVAGHSGRVATPMPHSRCCQPRCPCSPAVCGAAQLPCICSKPALPCAQGVVPGAHLQLLILGHQLPLALVALLQEEGLLTRSHSRLLLGLQRAITAGPAAPPERHSTGAPARARAASHSQASRRPGLAACKRQPLAPTHLPVLVHLLPLPPRLLVPQLRVDASDLALQLRALGRALLLLRGAATHGARPLPRVGLLAQPCSPGAARALVCVWCWGRSRRRGVAQGRQRVLPPSTPPAPPPAACCCPP